MKLDEAEWSDTQTVTLKEEANPTSSTSEGSGRFSTDSILLALAIITAVILAVFVVALMYQKSKEKPERT